jgi:metallo-beta-lactamase family protein
LHESGDRDPFGFSRLRYTHSVAESKALNDARNPLIVISASGMAEAGRVQHHLLHAVEDPRNAVLITGWQAPYTLGRRIAERSKTIKIFGDAYDLRADVHTFYGYSAHADRQDLLAWAKPHASTVHTAFVVHGEPEPATALAEGLRDLGYDRVIVPEREDRGGKPHRYEL